MRKCSTRHMRVPYIINLEYFGVGGTARSMNYHSYYYRNQKQVGCIDGLMVSGGLNYSKGLIAVKTQGKRSNRT